MIFFSVLSVLIVSAGIFFLTIAAVGALRLPDFYTRSHALGVVDTLGTLLVIGGLIVHYGFSLVSAKLFFLFVFIYLANPVMTHVFFRAAVRAGLKPWTLKDKK